MLNCLIILLLLSGLHAEAVSCKSLLSLENMNLASFYRQGTPVFERDSQVVAKISLTNDGSVAYVRKGPIGPNTTLAILTYLDPKGIIEGLDHVIHVGELNLFMNLIYKINQLYMMSEKSYRNFLVSAYGTYFRSGWLQRKWHVLEQVLDQYGVVRKPPEFLVESSLNWISLKSLKRHYRKHVTDSQEFSFDTPTDYESAASEFWRKKSSIASIILSPSEGHFIKYNYMTYEFSVIRNGKIITYFRMTEEYRLETEFDAYIAQDLLDRE